MADRWPLDADDRKWDSEADELRHKSLSNVRGVAEKWLGSIATVLGIIATILLIQGPEKLTDLKSADPESVVVLSLVAGVAAIVGLVSAIYAAQGLPRSVGYIDGFRLKELNQRRTKQAILAMTISRLAITVALLMLLIGTFYILFKELPADSGEAKKTQAIAVTSAGALSLPRSLATGRMLGQELPRVP